MKYVIRAEIEPEAGAALEKTPEKLEAMIGKWQALSPIAMYFSITRRSMTIVVEADNEDSFFEALHTTWVTARSYPDVQPVATAEEFPAIMQRLGLVG